MYSVSSLPMRASDGSPSSGTSVLPMTCIPSQGTMTRARPSTVDSKCSRDSGAPLMFEATTWLPFLALSHPDSPRPASAASSPAHGPAALTTTRARNLSDRARSRVGQLNALELLVHDGESGCLHVIQHNRAIALCVDDVLDAQTLRIFGMRVVVHGDSEETVRNDIGKQCDALAPGQHSVGGGALPPPPIPCPETSPAAPRRSPAQIGKVRPSRAMP